MTRNHWLFIAIAVLVVLFMGEFSRTIGSQASSPVISGSQRTTSAIRVVVSSQDAEGLTREQMDQTFLNNLESYTRARLLQMARKYLAANGQPNASIDLESEAVYVESDGKKLAVIRIRGSDGSYHVLVHGIEGGQLTRLLCTRTASERIPISYGPCGEGVREAFGVSLHVGTDQ